MSCTSFQADSNFQLLLVNIMKINKQHSPVERVRGLKVGPLTLYDYSKDQCNEENFLFFPCKNSINEKLS